MSVQFDEQEFARPRAFEKKESGLTSLIIKTGLAKNATQAGVVMVVIAVIAIALAVFLILPDRSTSNPLGAPAVPAAAPY